MTVSISDRIVSVLSYYTFGIFSIVWLIFANVAKKRISPYLYFNIFQAIFISVLLAAISLIYQIAINLISVIPFIGKLAISFHIFFNQTPLFFGFTLSGLIVTIFISVLSLLCLIGKKPYIPFVSDIVEANTGG